MNPTNSHSPAIEVRPATILVADDDPVMRALTTEVLRTAGYSVVEAADGGTALELARARRPDAIVIDLLMPQLSGTQVVQELRGRDVFRRIPVIMISGVDDVGYRVRALTAGVNDFVVKPVAPAELLARVEAQLRIASTVSGDSDPRWDNWRRAVVRDQAFGVLFQPMVDMRNGHAIAQEAIARFHDGTSPGEAFHGAGAIEPRTALELACSSGPWPSPGRCPQTSLSTSTCRHRQRTARTCPPSSTVSVGRASSKSPRTHCAE